MNPRVLYGLLASHADVRRLWLAETISAFGTYFFDIAVMWFVYVRTGSGLDTGLVAVAAFLPNVLVAPWLGAIADRLPRRRLMAGANLLTAGFAGLLALSIFLHHATLWEVYSVTLLMAIANAAYTPARSGLFPDLVPQARLLSANAVFHTSRQAARIIGSTAGGAVIALLGAAPTMLLDVLAFLIAALFVYAIRYRGPTARTGPQGQQPSLQEDIREAWQWVRERPVLIVMSAIGTTSNVALGPANVLPPMLIRTEFHANAAALGLFDAAIGAGIVLGGIFVGMLSIDRIGLVFAGALSLEGLGLVIVAASPSLYVAYAGNLVLGIGLVAANVPGATMSQILVPSELRGRVGSLFLMMSSVAIPITFGLVGVVGDAIGAHLTYGLASLLMLACVLAALLVKGIRGFRISGGLPGTTAQATTAPAEPV